MVSCKVCGETCIKEFVPTCDTSQKQDLNQYTNLLTYMGLACGAAIYFRAWTRRGRVRVLCIAYAVVHDRSRAGTWNQVKQELQEPSLFKNTLNGLPMCDTGVQKLTSAPRESGITET